MHNTAKRQLMFLGFIMRKWRGLKTLMFMGQFEGKRDIATHNLPVELERMNSVEGHGKDDKKSKDRSTKDRKLRRAMIANVVKEHVTKRKRNIYKNLTTEFNFLQYIFRSFFLVFVSFNTKFLSIKPSAYSSIIYRSYFCMSLFKVIVII